MKTIKQLKILNLCNHFFKEMIYISDVEPEYIMIYPYYPICVILMKVMYYIVFNNIECIFSLKNIYRCI